MRLQGAAAIVTGASSGIGQALVVELTRRGASVLAAARNEDALRALCERIGPHAAYRACDVTSDEDARARAADCAERFGWIDLLVNNAGIGRVGLLEETPVEDVRALLETNALGAVRCTLAALPYLRARGAGRIAFVASLYGRVVLPYAGAYAISKHALLAFTDTLRLELDSSGIGVTTICPANVETPLWERTSAASGRRARMIGPVLRMDDLVRVTLDALERDRDEVYLPPRLRLLAVAQRTGTRAHRRLRRRWLGR